VANNGNLYFFSNREDSFGGCDIYISRYIDGRFLPPENLGNAINSPQNDWDSCIAPDESYIIFSSQNRDDTLGGQDLYISFRKENKAWTKARNMGPSVNSHSGEICPSVSLDGKYLFFTSRRRGKADIFWVKADIIDKLRPKQ
jgi:Tol biopolymer transport system component